MSETTDPWGPAWDSFFQTRPLPLDEEQAFRQYLAAHQVPGASSIQDLTAHYNQFRREWDPGPLPAEGHP
jgi:hypothetical protein